MLLAVNALRFPFVNVGHEEASLVLTLKLEAHGLAFLAETMMSPAHRGLRVLL
jgi:hypothetical protein